MSFLNITGVDLKELAKAAYRHSRAQGLGILHVRDGELSDKDAELLTSNNHGGIVLSMDYVHGRACKFNVWKRGEELFIRSDWYDHSDHDLRNLLRDIGKADAPTVEEIPEREAA